MPACAVSVVVPTLNESQAIGSTLACLRRVPGIAEVIVVDAGSTDGTAAAAEGYGARVVTAERGKGTQLRAGAALAGGEALWFLHADTIVPPDAALRIQETLADPDVAGGNFALRFDGASAAARQLTWLYPRLRCLGLCYGDSGIFVRRTAYERIGGVRPWPLFEDVDLVRRLRQVGRFVHLPGELVTSSRRFENRPFGLVFARWTALQLLYWAGVPPRWLIRAYAPVREAHSPAGRAT